MLKQLTTLKKFAFTILLGLAAQPLFAHTTIPATDPQWQYTGRIDFTDPAAPQLSWPGTSIAAKFSGSYLAVILDDQLGKNYFNVFVDNDFAHPLIIAANKGEHSYLVATNLSTTVHTFLLTKRTEGEEGSTAFKGIELDDQAALQTPPPRPTRKIEFFGDSITTGMGDESPDDGPDDRARDKNNFMSYDAITARSLNAELHVTSQSGIGVMISWFPFIMPQFYEQLSAVGKNDSRWDFSSWTPDVVVINLLQNDAWLIDGQHRLKPEPNDEQRVQAYAAFVKSIRKKYPQAYLICALGSMDATRPGSKWPGYVSTAVNRLNQENPQQKIDTIFFEFTGFRGHPRVKQQLANAEKLTAMIRQKMHW